MSILQIYVRNEDTPGEFNIVVRHVQRYQVGADCR
jgi:hypothetical protein